MGTGVHEVPPGAGHPPLCTGIERAEQPDTADNGDAGNKAEQLRTAEAVAMGTHPGKAVQDKREGDGPGAGAAGGFGILQPDHEHRDFVPCGQGGGGRGNDAGDDDVADIHHRATECSRKCIHRLQSGTAGCENQSGTVERDTRTGR